MTTVDQFLLKLHSVGIDHLNPDIPKRDKRILISLATQLIAGVFLTENQSRLLVKILKENKQYLEFPETEIIELPLWSQSFRQVEQVRKLYIKDDQLIVDFTFNKSIKKIVADISKELDGSVSIPTPSQYIIPLTEKNIFTVITALKRERFVVSTQLHEFYITIREAIAEGTNPFDIESISDKRLVAAINADIDTANPVLVNDRKTRFQYSTTPITNPTTLTEKIAARTDRRLFVSSSTVDLSELVQSIQTLNRFPVMLVFDSYNAVESSEMLARVQAALTKENIADVGVYFRFQNNEDGKQFNDAVKQFAYNQHLTQATHVVGIANNQIPKFLFKANWYPKTVISFTNNFRSNKATVFADAVDLVIFYTKTQPLGNTIDEIL